MSIHPEFRKDMHWRLLMDSGLISALDYFADELESARNPTAVDVVDASRLALEHACQTRIKDHAVLFNHPLRVASILLRHEPRYSADLIALALLHNSVEKGLFSEMELAKIANERVASGVSFLSKIRGTEKSDDQIRQFYSEICMQDDGGLRAKVKVADKLDNLYMLCFNPDSEVREKYLEEIETFVLPLAERFLPNAFDKVSAACAWQRRLDFLDRDKEVAAAKELFHDN
jgi:(p)ppGpp synthase/HD superfamily hydrolase